MSGTPCRTALYRIFGDADLLLYIGISKNFGKRWNQHARKQPWWDEHRRMTVDWFDSRPEAEEAETAAIKAEGPKYNKAHALRSRKVAVSSIPAGWMTVSAAARTASCSRQCLWKAEQDGRLEVRRTPGKHRPLIHEDELARWMATRQPRKVVPFGLTPRQAEFLLDIYLRRTNIEYGHFISTSKALRRRGMIADGLYHGHVLTAEGQRVASELVRQQGAMASAA